MISQVHNNQPVIPPIDFPVTPSLVNELMSRYDLSSLAIESLSVYVELAQTPQIRRALEMVGSKGGDLTEDVLDRASTASWCKGFYEQKKHWGRLEKVVDDLSVKGLYTASLFLAYGKILDATGGAQLITIPTRFRDDFPCLFGQDRTVLLDEKLF